MVERELVCAPLSPRVRQANKPSKLCSRCGGLRNSSPRLATDKRAFTSSAAPPPRVRSSAPTRSPPLFPARFHELRRDRACSLGSSPRIASPTTSPPGSTSTHRPPRRDRGASSPVQACPALTAGACTRTATRRLQNPSHELGPRGPPPHTVSGLRLPSIDWFRPCPWPSGVPAEKSLARRCCARRRRGARRRSGGSCRRQRPRRAPAPPSRGPASCTSAATTSSTTRGTTR